MSNNENQSEVARLRQQIDAEYEAMALLQSGLSITTKHAFIDARMHNVDRHCEQLIPLIGKEATMELVIEVNNRYAPWQRKEESMGDREEQSLFEFEASTEEYKALQRMADIYIHYLESTILPTMERALIVADIRSWQSRPRSPYEHITRWECSRAEAIALAGAASCYSRLVVTIMPYSEGERTCKNLVMAFQQRYQDVVMSLLP